MRLNNSSRNRMNAARRVKPVPVQKFLRFRRKISLQLLCKVAIQWRLALCHNGKFGDQFVKLIVRVKLLVLRPQQQLSKRLKQ